jgi:hypothetical protein
MARQISKKDREIEELHRAFKAQRVQAAKLHEMKCQEFEEKSEKQKEAIYGYE